MEQELLEKINEQLSFETLSDIAKTALSALYRKLREEEGFGYTQCCCVSSIGSREYDVEALIIDSETYGRGANWNHIFRL